MPQVRTGKSVGRPSKKTPETIERILRVARTGLPLKFAAQAGSIDVETLSQWVAKDPELEQALTKARLEAVEERWQLIKRAAEGYKENPPDWRAVAWQLERTNLDFARPEVALTLQQNSVTQNFLSISISEKDAREIEAEAAPIREGVQAMFQAYRPGAKGNGEGKVHDVEAEPVSEQPQQAPAGQQPPITHKEGDENRQGFWRSLVSSDPDVMLVEQKTAVFVCRLVLAKILGYRANGINVSFEEDPVQLSDMFAALERWCGGPAGWQFCQKRAGY